MDPGDRTQLIAHYRRLRPRPVRLRCPAAVVSGRPRDPLEHCETLKAAEKYIASHKAAWRNDIHRRQRTNPSRT
jgi:hypothetical protein